MLQSKFSLEHTAFGLLGFLAIYFLGYTLLNIFLGRKKLSLKKKFFLCPAFYFFFMILIDVFNILLDGKIISNKTIIVEISIILLVTGTIITRKQIKDDLNKVLKTLHKIKLKKRNYSYLLKIFATLALVVVVCYSSIFTYINLSIRRAGDLSSHLLWTNQLLKGYAHIHRPPYSGISSFYPQILHISISFTKQLLDCNVLDSFLSMAILQSLNLVLGTLVIFSKIIKRFAPSFFSTVLVCLNGGLEFFARGSWLFNTSHLLIHPNFLPRQISLILMILFLNLFIDLVKKDSNKLMIFVTGMIFGIIGLFHPSPFFSIALFLFIAFIIYKKLRVKIFYIFSIGIIISLLYYYKIAVLTLKGSSLNVATVYKPLLDPLILIKILGIVFPLSILSMFCIYKFCKINKILKVLFTSQILLFVCTITLNIVLPNFITILFHRYCYIYYWISCLGIALLLSNLHKLKEQLIIRSIYATICITMPISYPVLLSSKDWKPKSYPLRKKIEYLTENFNYTTKEDVISVPADIRDILISSGIDTVFAYKSFSKKAKNPMVGNEYNQNERAKDYKNIYNKETSENELKKTLQKYRVTYIVTYDKQQLELEKNDFISLYKEDLVCNTNQKCTIYKVNLDH